MTAFEKWQVGLGVLTACILLAAALLAFYVGLKQNEINERLLDLNYVVSLEITHVPGQIRVRNKGKTNVALWGSKIRDRRALIEDDPRTITPGGFYYLHSQDVETALAKDASDGINEQVIPLELYVEAANGTRWIVRTLLYSVVSNSNVQIHTQTVSAAQSDWGRGDT